MVKGGVTAEPEVGAMPFEDGRRDHEPKNAGPPEAGKGKELISPHSFQEECSPASTLALNFSPSELNLYCFMLLNLL